MSQEWVKVGFDETVVGEVRVRIVRGERRWGSMRQAWLKVGFNRSGKGDGGVLRVTSR